MKAELREADGARSRGPVNFPMNKTALTQHPRWSGNVKAANENATPICLLLRLIPFLREPFGGEFPGEHPVPVRSPALRQRGDSSRGFGHEPDRARPGFRITKQHAGAVVAQVFDRIPGEAEDFQEARPVHGQADRRDGSGVGPLVRVQRRAKAPEFRPVEVLGDRPARVLDDVSAGVGDVLAEVAPLALAPSVWAGSPRRSTSGRGRLLLPFGPVSLHTLTRAHLCWQARCLARRPCSMKGERNVH